MGLLATVVSRLVNVLCSKHLKDNFKENQAHNSILGTRASIRGSGESSATTVFACSPKPRCQFKGLFDGFVCGLGSSGRVSLAVEVGDIP